MNLNKTNAINSMYGKLADVYTGRGQAKADMWSSIASGGGRMLAGAFAPEAFRTTGNTGSNTPSISFAPTFTLGGNPINPNDPNVIWSQQGGQNPNYASPSNPFGMGSYNFGSGSNYTADPNYSFGSFNRNTNYRSPFGFNY